VEQVENPVIGTTTLGIENDRGKYLVNNLVVILKALKID